MFSKTALFLRTGRITSIRATSLLHSSSALQTRWVHVAPSTLPPPDPPLPRDQRMKRLIYRAQQRGWKELDIIVGKWAVSNTSSLSDQELDQFEALLAEEIPDLFKWLSGQEPVPEIYRNSVMDSLKAFAQNGNVLGLSKTSTSVSAKRVVKTSDAPAAIGPYSQAIQANGFLFISGVLGLNPKTMEFPSEDVVEQTEMVVSNMRAILEAGNSSPAHVVKTTVLLADMADYAKVNEVYGRLFESEPPARSAFACKTLPKNARVEIEAIALLKDSQ